MVLYWVTLILDAMEWLQPSQLVAMADLERKAQMVEQLDGMALSDKLVPRP